MSTPHPAKTLDEVRAMKRRFSIAQLFEDEAQWFAAKAMTIPSHDEKSAQDMETYLAAIRPMPAWLDAVRDLMVERNVVACIDEGVWGSVAAARASLAHGEAVLASWSSPHPPKTLDEVRAMTKRHSIAQLFEDEAQWFVTKAKTMPSIDEKSEQDMATYVAEMRPLLAWLDAVKELMVERAIFALVDEKQWEPVMLARECLARGQTALASWKLARETAARKAAEDARQMAEEDAKRAIRKRKMRGNVPSRVTRRRTRGSAMECDEASSHDSDIVKPPNKRHKLRLPDNEPGKPLDIPRGKQGTRPARAPETCTAAPSHKYEKAPVKKAPDLSSLAVDIFPSLVPVERQETELREVATRLALASLRIQYLSCAMQENAAILNSSIMDFGATLMRREAEEEERAALGEGVPFTD